MIIVIAAKRGSKILAEPSTDLPEPQGIDR